MRHKTAPPVAEVPQARFASDDFAYYLRLNKAAPYWHEPITNLGVTQGSGPMMFFVGTMGDAASQSQALYGPILARQTPG